MIFEKVKNIIFQKAPFLHKLETHWKPKSQLSKYILDNYLTETNPDCLKPRPARPRLFQTQYIIPGYSSLNCCELSENVCPIFILFASVLILPCPHPQFLGKWKNFRPHKHIKEFPKNGENIKKKIFFFKFIILAKGSILDISFNSI